jgi:hypothetical protein
MSRLRLAALSATIGCGLMLAGGTGVASAQTAPPLTKTIALTGAGKNGKQFTGKYTIDRFVAGGGKLYSVGTLTGKLGVAARGRPERAARAALRRRLSVARRRLG